MVLGAFKHRTLHLKQTIMLVNTHHRFVSATCSSRYQPFMIMEVFTIVDLTLLMYYICFLFLSKCGYQYPKFI